MMMIYDEDSPRGARITLISDGLIASEQFSRKVSRRKEGRCRRQNGRRQSALAVFPEFNWKKGFATTTHLTGRERDPPVPRVFVYDDRD